MAVHDAYAYGVPKLLSTDSLDGMIAYSNANGKAPPPWAGAHGGGPDSG